MSTAYGLMSFYGGMNAYEALKLSESAADRALQLDPSLADGHISRGFIIENLHRNLPAAEREMRRAIDLSPKSADAHHALALVLADQGKFDEAIAESRRSEELDPLWPGNRSTTGWIYYDARRYDDALRVLNLFAPEFGPAHWSRGLTYVALGRYQEAVHEFETADASSALYKSQKAHAYAVMGRTADARKLLAEILAERQRGYVSPANIAGIYAGLNEPQAALHWLHIADLECDSWLQRVRFDPRFDRLRSLPDFQQILESITTPR
jgi:tetratricopeptide (TPR) repeat protein